jgi:hypothetical protein
MNYKSGTGDLEFRNGLQRLMRKGKKKNTKYTHHQHVIDKFDIKSYTGTLAPSTNF